MLARDLAQHIPLIFTAPRSGLRPEDSFHQKFCSSRRGNYSPEHEARFLRRKARYWADFKAFQIVIAVRHKSRWVRYSPVGSANRCPFLPASELFRIGVNCSPCPVLVRPFDNRVSIFRRWATPEIRVSPSYFDLRLTTSVEPVQDVEEWAGRELSKTGIFGFPKDFWAFSIL